MRAQSGRRGFLNMGLWPGKPLQILMEKWSPWMVMLTKFRVRVVSQRLLRKPAPNGWQGTKRREVIMQLGMIGLGRMGANMVRRLLRAGHDADVFDMSSKAVAELVAEKAIGSSSLA